MIVNKGQSLRVTKRGISSVIFELSGSPAPVVWFLDLEFSIRLDFSSRPALEFLWAPLLELSYFSNRSTPGSLWAPLSESPHFWLIVGPYFLSHFALDSMWTLTSRVISPPTHCRPPLCQTLPVSLDFTYINHNYDLGLFVCGSQVLDYTHISTFKI